MVVTLPDLDLAAVLQPISADAPAGNPHAYTREIRGPLQALRQEERPEDFDEATRPAQLKKSDWPGVVRLATDALQTKTKDLRVACHLLEGLAWTSGFAGMSCGLELLRRLVGECWDRLNPPIEGGDLEQRAAPLSNMLDDPVRGIAFPCTVRHLPLVVTPQRAYGLIEWLQLRRSPLPEAQQEVARVVAGLSQEQLDGLGRSMAGCLEQLQGLVLALEEKLGAAAPALTNLKAALEECQAVVREERSRLLPVEPAAVAPAAGQAEAGEVKTSAAGAAATRAEAYLQLTRAAELLEQLEPHSPIPYLVKRAVRLGRLPFPQLMERIIRDGNVLKELQREMGFDPEELSGER